MQHTSTSSQVDTCAHDTLTAPSTRPPHASPRSLVDDRGAATAEYAIVILAAVVLGGVLVTIMRSSEIQAMLMNLVENAFGAAG